MRPAASNFGAKARPSSISAAEPRGANGIPVSGNQWSVIRDQGSGIRDQ
jgi:hypothetical protein